MSEKLSWLTKQHKEAIALLSIGTFLEYFDLMLYIHMAVLLNELFFPQNDPLVAKLLAAFTFCSTFFLRPIGGMIIGWIGDQIGRRSTIMLTTSIMAATCVTMASVGTYAEIGATSCIIVIICRALQGISSLGEIIGAQLYLTETLKQPYKYIANGAVEIGSRMGGLFALVIASFAISVNLNWRLAFWAGAAIAFVGFFARIKLREAPEFVDFKRRLKIKIEINKQNPEIIENSFAYQEQVDKKAVLAYFLIRMATPVCFYITYIYIGSFMKESLGFTAEQVINQNLKVTILTVIGLIITVLLLKKYHPIKIAEKYIVVFSVLLPFIPYCLGNISNMFLLSILQFVTFSIALSSFAIEMACFKYLPIARRFTILATTFGVASTLSYTIVSFSLIPLVKYFGYYAILIIYVPVIIGLIWGINYIKRLEKSNGKYLSYPNEDDTINLYTDLAEENYNYDFENAEEYKSYNIDCKYAQNLLNIVQNKAEKENKKIDLKLIQKAIIFAKKWHEGQFRDNGEPFYSHPFRVAGIVAEYYLKTEVIVGAILHDVVEDSDCSIELLEKEFNSRIAQIVERLTKIKFKEGGKIKYSLQETINQLHAVNDYEALLIKQVDRAHNLETIGKRSEKKQTRIALETHNFLITTVSYIFDRLNITNNLNAESKLFQDCRNILLKKSKK